MRGNVSLSFSAKNSKLIKERNIGFEEIISAIESEQVLDVLENPNHEKYGGQKIYVVFAKEYVYLFPYVIDDEGNIFLKTIIREQKSRVRY